MIKAFAFFLAKRLFAILRIYQHPYKKRIYKKFFKMVQRLSGRAQKVEREYMAGGLSNQTAFSAGIDHYLLELKSEGYCFIPPPPMTLRVYAPFIKKQSRERKIWFLC